MADEETKEKSWLSNPALNEYDGPLDHDTSNRATVVGTAFKSIVLFAILAVTFGFTWHLSTQGYSEQFAQAKVAAEAAGNKPPDSISIPNNVIGLATGGILVGFVVAMVVIFWKRSAPFLAPVYAACEGLALGAISAGFEAKYPGIVIEATVGVFGTALSMLVLYSTGLIKPTQKLAVILLVAMLGILCLYMTDSVMRLFGSYVPVVHSNGTWGILLQMGIVVVGAISLVFDFDEIVQAAEDKAPKWYEWYGAFGLMVTLVWLYIEMLRLRQKLAGND